jgi:hypothetical protein
MWLVCCGSYKAETYVVFEGWDSGIGVYEHKKVDKKRKAAFMFMDHRLPKSLDFLIHGTFEVIINLG